LGSLGKGCNWNQTPSKDEKSNFSGTTNYVSKEISWLAFNERVLQEAADPAVPLLERLKFLGIYSSNRDEFFRVRVATLKRLVQLGPQAKELIHGDPNRILEEVQSRILQQQDRFEKLYGELEKDLRREQIYFSDGSDLSDAHLAYIRDFSTARCGPT
jgi:polyphosphate kinase